MRMPLTDGDPPDAEAAEADGDIAGRLRTVIDNSGIATEAQLRDLHTSIASLSVMLTTSSSPALECLRSWTSLANDLLDQIGNQR
jgi:hypothetical protein